MNFPKLNFSPYSKDTVKMLAQWANKNQQDVGLICSVSQVNADVGYTGFTPRTLADFVSDVKEKLNSSQDLFLCRDHLGKSENSRQMLEILIEDEIAGFKLAHLHCETFRIISDCMLATTQIQFELGTGESPVKMWPSQKGFIKALVNDVPMDRVEYLTFPTGCLISEVYNHNNVNHQLCQSMRRFDIKLKGHNSDYANVETLTALSKYIDAINIAPQLGVVMTRTYVTLARTYGIDLRDWEQEVFDSEEWKRWGSERYAIELGGQYHFNKLPTEFTSMAYDSVKEVVFALLDYYNRTFRKELM